MNSLLSAIQRLGRAAPVEFKRLPLLGAAARRLEAGSSKDEADEVAPGLYVGSAQSGRHAAHEYDMCVSVADGLEFETTDISFDLNPTDGSTNYEFTAAVQAVSTAWEREDSVLVHCHEGRERAPTVAATAIAKANGWSFADAVQHVRLYRQPFEPTAELRTLARGYLDDAE